MRPPTTLVIATLVSDEAEEETEKAAEVSKPLKKKKRKKKPIVEDEVELEPWRPGFAAHFPRDEELDRLVRAFNDGDYRRVREEAPALASRTKDAAIRSAAQELRERIDPSRASLVMLVLAAVLLALLAGYYWTHKHV